MLILTDDGDELVLTRFGTYKNSQTVTSYAICDRIALSSSIKLSS